MANKSTTHTTHGDGAFAIGILPPHLEGIPKAAQPFIEYGAKLQSEFLTLWSHRTQAWLNLPKQALACRTPADVVEMQGRFLTTMLRHYRECFDAALQDSVQVQNRLEETAAEKTPEQPTTPQHRAAA